MATLHGIPCRGEELNGVKSVQAKSNIRSSIQGFVFMDGLGGGAGMAKAYRTFSRTTEHVGCSARSSMSEFVARVHVFR
jgi:hypothetical protein